MQNYNRKTQSILFYLVVLDGTKSGDISQDLVKSCEICEIPRELMKSREIWWNLVRVGKISRVLGKSTRFGEILQELMKSREIWWNLVRVGKI